MVAVRAEVSVAMRSTGNGCAPPAPSRGHGEAPPPCPRSNSCTDPCPPRVSIAVEASATSSCRPAEEDHLMAVCEPTCCWSRAALRARLPRRAGGLPRRRGWAHTELLKVGGRTGASCPCRSAGWRPDLRRRGFFAAPREPRDRCGRRRARVRVWGGCRVRAGVGTVARGEPAEGARCRTSHLRSEGSPWTVLDVWRLCAHVRFELRTPMCVILCGSMTVRNAGVRGVMRRLRRV